MLPRFYVPAASHAGTDVSLPADEAAHLTRVLRLQRGDLVRVFDGGGLEWVAVIQSIGNRLVTVNLREAVTPAAESGLAITLAVAALKGDKMDDVVRDAVMLGVVAVQPLLTERTEIRASTIARSGRIARWQRVAIASAKQCGRAVVPVIRSAVSLADALSQSPAGTRILLVEPDARASEVRSFGELPKTRDIELFVGPEGGWADRERAAAVAAGSMLVTLGGLTLRADAAPVVAMTALRVRWEDW